MNNSTLDMKGLFGSTLFENITISATPAPSPAADETKGYAAQAWDAAEFEASARAPLSGFLGALVSVSAQEASARAPLSGFLGALSRAPLSGFLGALLSVSAQEASARAPLSAQGQKVESALLLYSSWLMRDYGIHIAQSDKGLQLHHDGQYLVMGGLESAIVDWDDDGYVIDPNLVENDTFFFLNEKRGVQISLNEVTQFYPIEKTATDWPSVDSVLATLEDDRELLDYLKSSFLHDTSWEKLSVVALTHRAHRTASLRARVDALRTGQLLSPSKRALEWLQSLNAEQFTRVQQLMNTRLLLMHDLMDDVQTSALDKGEGKEALTDLAYDREVIEALLVLLRDLGVKTTSLQSLVESLDARGEEVITIAPFIDSLGDDLVLARSRELSPSTWWTGLWS